MKMCEIFDMPVVSDEGCILDAAYRYKIDFNTSDTNCLQQIEAVKKAINNHDELVEKLEFISGWLCENAEYEDFKEIFEWGTSTEKLLISLKGLE